MADSNQPQAPAPKPGGYGKRPLWQWILLYVIIGAIVYYGIYYFAVQRHHNSSGSSTTNSIY